MIVGRNSLTIVFCTLEFELVLCSAIKSTPDIDEIKYSNRTFYRILVQYARTSELTAAKLPYSPVFDISSDWTLITDPSP